MRRIVSVVIALLCLVGAARLNAQPAAGQNYTTQTGVPSNNAMYPVPGGAVNLDTGNLFLKFPLVSLPERSGRPYTLSLVYNSVFWSAVADAPYAMYYPQTYGGLSLSVDFGGQPYPSHDTFPDTANPCPLAYPGGDAEVYTNYRVVDSNGTEVSFGPVLQAHYHNCYSASGPEPGDPSGTPAVAGYDVTGHGYYLSVANNGQNYTMWAPDGSVITANASTSGSQNDTNGNLLGITGYDSKTGNPIDQLGRISDLGYSGCLSVSETAPAGPCSFTVQTDDGPQTYVLQYGAIPVCTAFGTGTEGQYCGNIYMPISLTLPGDTGSYTFSYDEGSTPGHYGTIKTITLPTGGTLSYNFVPNTLGQNASILSGNPLPQSASDGTGATTFAFSSTGLYNLAVNMLDPRGDSVIYSENIGNNGTTYTYTKVLTQYSGTSTPLKTTTTVSNDDVHPTSITTTLNDIGKSSTVTYQYQPNTWFLSLKQESDFTGAIIRTTKTSYLGDTGSIPYVSTYHILNRPHEIQVFAGGSTSGAPVSQTIYSYDEYGTVCPTMQTESAAGHLTSYGASYPARGNVTSIAQLVSGGTTATSHLCYDVLGSVAESIDANGNTTTINNQDVWAANTESCQIGGGTRAFPTTIVNALGQWENRTYSKCSGQIIADQNANDIANSRVGTVYSYQDPLNRLTGVSHPDKGSSSTQYNSPNERTDSTAMSSTQSETVVTTLDGLGRVTQTELVTDPQGADYVNESYDASGNMQSISNRHRTYSSPSTDGTTKFQYDALGRMTIQTQPDGTSTLQWCYNGVTNGQNNCTTNKSSITAASWVDYSDELGKHSQRVSDAAGRLVAVVEPDAQTGSPSYETDYTYDVLNNLTRVDQYGGSKGNSIYTDKVRTFTYDGLSRLSCASNPETSTVQCPSTLPGATTYSYDSNGNVKSRTDPRNVVTSYDYDALNRIIGKAYDTTRVTPGLQAVAPTSSVNYTYDVGDASWGWTPQTSPSWPSVSQTNLIGRLSGVAVGTVGANAWTVYGYDEMGRTVLKSECLPIDCGNNHHDMHYKYDLAGNMTFYDRGLDLAANSRTPNQGYYYGGFTEQYDGAGNLGAVTGDTAGTNRATNIWSNADYFPTGQPYTALAMGLYNLKYSVTPRGWVTGQGITNTAGHSIWQSSTTYNINGTISITTDTHAGGWTFTYDQLNRIATANSPTANLAYSIDPFGNKYKQTITWGSMAPSPNYGISATSNALTGNGLTYDLGASAAGNVTYDGFHHYIYDGEGRLYSVDSTTCFTYDGDGDRVAMTNCNVVNYGNGDTTGILSEYLYDFNHRLMAQIDPTTSKIVRANIYAGNNYLAEDASDSYLTNSPTATQLRVTDQVGTLRGLWDLSGNMTNACTSFPYGDGMNCTNSQTTGPGLFTGNDRDSVSISDLDYFGARFYSSTMGRFVSPDPSGLSFADPTNPQSLNLYSYAQNNPLTNTDPTGLQCVWDDGSFDSYDDPESGDFNSCTGLGGTWYEPGTYAPGVDWASTNSNGTLTLHVDTSGSSSYTPPTADDAADDVIMSTLYGKLVDATDSLMNVVVGGSDTDQSSPSLFLNTTYCGPGGAGPTTGVPNGLCYVHDRCFDRAGLDANSNTPGGPGMTSSQMKAAKACNQGLYNGARSNPNARGSKALQWWLTNGAQVPFRYILYPGTEAVPW
jgi:RHS repeat-associated protein